MKYNSRKDTLKHIKTVEDFLGVIIGELYKRGVRHDASKLKSPEKEIFDEFTPKLREVTYGSEKYKKYLREMEPALYNHYKHNSHHPEHYGYLECDICFTHHDLGHDGQCKACRNGSFTFRPDVSGMSLLDIIEMLADWKAAGMRHADGDFLKSLEINKERFEISEQLYKVIVNTAKELGWI